MRKKSKRLYLEVRYCRDTCLSLPKSSDLFRLKKNYKNLPNEHYVSNLCIYLDKIEASSSASMSDLKNVLDELAS